MDIHKNDFCFPGAATLRILPCSCRVEMQRLLKMAIALFFPPKGINPSGTDFTMIFKSVSWQGSCKIQFQVEHPPPRTKGAAGGSAPLRAAAAAAAAACPDRGGRG